jgi:hypothetical protein
MPPHPCAFRHHRCTRRWIALCLLSLILPCLCLYLPLSGKLFKNPDSYSKLYDLLRSPKLDSFEYSCFQDPMKSILII